MLFGKISHLHTEEQNAADKAGVGTTLGRTAPIPGLCPQEDAALPIYDRVRGNYL